MCGIFAYTGGKNAGEVLLEGLTSLEYRGYDSAGVYTPESGSIKAKGAVHQLKRKIPSGYYGKSGIAHLRWATHGEPTESNAHPHSDCTNDVWVVHNGIIENFQELKAKLIKKGHTFASDTDTEVVAHLVEDHLLTEKDFEKAAFKALNDIRGAYGMVLQYRHEPQKLIGARLGAPVVIGLGDGEGFVASDASPILRHTRTVVFLNDGEVAVVTPDGHSISTLDSKRVDRTPEQIEWDAEEAKRDGYDHFMMKEIMEAPEVVRNTIRGRLIPEEGRAKLGGLEAVADELRNVKRLIIAGCGTAYYAGVTGEYMLEEHARIPVEVELGSEFRYRSPILNENTAVIAVSQSGETADTLEAVREGKRKGAITLGIVNTVGSTIARETDAGVYNHAGPEIGVASTKALVSQLTAFALLTMFLGRQRDMSMTEGKIIAEALAEIPEKIERILANKEHIEQLAKKYAKCRDFMYIGRKYNYAIAFEGALKLKEISYVHAEGCGAGEMKHGPLAMIDENFPTIAIAPSDSVYEKMISNIQVVRARKGPIIAVATEGNDGIKDFADDVMYIPETIEMLQPILSVIPLQLFAYYFAKEKGYNVDRPRNLAKSVTVE
jgi:glucosamine--fructose-6-phosphate aminotransferase (isomerizing)